VISLETIDIVLREIVLKEGNMTTQSTVPSNRGPWILVGVLGCMALCLMLLIAGGILYMVFRPTQVTTKPPATSVTSSSPIATLAPMVPISPQNLNQVIKIRQLSQSGFSAKLAWSPDSRTLGVANGKTIKLWDAATGKELQTFSFELEVSGLAFSPDSSMLAVGTNAASLYDVATGRQLRAFPEVVTLPNGWVLGGGMNVAFSPDGKKLAGGMMGGTAILWDVASGEKVQVFSDPSKDASPYSSLAFSPDGNILAHAHKRVSLWDVTTGDLIRALPVESNLVMFLSDGKTVRTMCNRWDITTGTGSGSCSEINVACAAFSSDETLAAVWQMPLPGFGPVPGAKINAGLVRDLGSDTGCPLAFSPDKRWLVTGYGPIRLWGVPP
jgi:WD40 repeat protein